MEIKAILIKPYTEKDRTNFIVEYNHRKGYVIKETETELQAIGMTEEEKQQEEMQRVALLSLTAADVERGIYKATGKDFNDVIKEVETLNQVQGDNLNIDIKALKIELKANNFYRGNPYVDSIGSLLGFTKEQLDLFFETNDYLKLLAVEE